MVSISSLGIGVNVAGVNQLSSAIKASTISGFRKTGHVHPSSRQISSSVNHLRSGEKFFKNYKEYK